jgi:hypothetical protein
MPKSDRDCIGQEMGTPTQVPIPVHSRMGGSEERQSAMAQLQGNTFSLDFNQVIKSSCFFPNSRYSFSPQIVHFMKKVYFVATFL